MQFVRSIEVAQSRQYELRTDNQAKALHAEYKERKKILATGKKAKR